MHKSLSWKSIKRYSSTRAKRTNDIVVLSMLVGRLDGWMHLQHTHDLRDQPPTKNNGFDTHSYSKRSTTCVPYRNNGMYMLYVCTIHVRMRTDHVCA